MSIFFLGVWHLGHEACISYCNRPFKNTVKMDSTLIRNHNSIVSKEDTTYFLGDMSMRGSLYKDYLESNFRKINGRKILILGNHDRLNSLDYVNMGFESVHTSLEVRTSMLISYFLIHDPATFCATPDTPMICGHVHSLFKYYTVENTKKYHRRIVNVGVDVHNFYPVSLKEIKGYLMI